MKVAPNRERSPAFPRSPRWGREAPNGKDFGIGLIAPTDRVVPRFGATAGDVLLVTGTDPTQQASAACDLGGPWRWTLCFCKLL
jgi:hypothetical protein